MGELIRGFGPFGERVGVDSDLEIFAKDGHVFAKIEAVAEFGDGRVTFGDLCDWRWAQQPSGERVLTDTGAGEREKFEEAGLSEEIEISGVKAGVNVDAGCRLARTGLVRGDPSIFDSSEAVAIEGYGAVSASASPENSGVKNDDCKKYQKGEK